MASAPLILTPVPKEDIERGDGPLVSRFIEGTPEFVAGNLEYGSEEWEQQRGYCRITMESLGGAAGQLMRLRPWQHNITNMIFARRPDGRYRHRQAMIGLPRKNGKSALASSYALQALVMGGQGSQVFSCASDKNQAKIVFDVAKQMIKADPLLDFEQGGILRCMRDEILYPDKGSVYKVLSSEAYTKEGLNPTVIIFDELHALPTDDMYNVMRLAQGSRRDPLMIIITTAGVKADQTGQDSICYRLYQKGRQVASGEDPDKSFFMAWWGAPDGADYKDQQVWADANPGFNDLLDEEDFRSVLGSVSENQFRTKRLNQWVSSAEAWLPQGAWEACRNEREFVPGGRGVVLGFDGSMSGDSTALVAVTVDTDPQVKVLGCWERPPGPEGRDWKVSRGEVKDAIRKACKTYHVREIACDEWRWQDALDELEEEGLPIVAFPQTMQRMSPATHRFYEMVMNQKIGHDGNKALARHLDNAVLRREQRGERIVKDKKESPRKIDLAVAAVMAVERAAFWLSEPMEGSYIWKDAQGVEHSKPIEDIGFVW